MNKLTKSVKRVVVNNGDEEERNASTTKDLMLETLGVFNPGLLVVTVPNGQMLPQIRAVLEREIISGSQKMGLRFPKKTSVKSLHAGNGSKVSQAKALALAQKPIEGVTPQEFLAIGTREGFNLACDEGLCVVLPIIEKGKGCWVTFAQTVDGSPGPSLVETFMRLRQAAKQAGSFVLLILVTNRKPEELRLMDYCDDVVVIGTCEPDPDILFAFSTDVVGLRDLNEMGIGKNMCSIRVRKGQYTWTWETFISFDVLKRVVWKLRCSGKSLADIGKMISCDKSTVHRHMLGLPRVVKREQKEGWLKPYEDMIEIAIDSDENSESEDD